MKQTKWFAMVLAMTSMIFLLGASRGGCGGGLNNRKGEPGIDVGGTAGAQWKVTYSKTMEIKLKNAAGVIATKEYTTGAGGELDIDGVKIDVSKLCERPDVACPHEVFPQTVTMTQPGEKLHLLYVTFNKEGPLKDTEKTTLLGNVDSDYDFSIALGIKGATNGICGLLAVSYATGHIEQDPLTKKGTKMEGDIVTGYTGACAVVGEQGTVAAEITVEIRVPFVAKRL